METTVDASKDRGLHQRPLVHDHRIVEAQCFEAEGSRDGVAHEILVPHRHAIVVQPPVDLEDEPIAEHEVDPADAGDLDLTRERDAEWHSSCERCRWPFARKHDMHRSLVVIEQPDSGETQSTDAPDDTAVGGRRAHLGEGVGRNEDTLSNPKHDTFSHCDGQRMPRDTGDGEVGRTGDLQCGAELLDAGELDGHAPTLLEVASSFRATYGI